MILDANALIDFHWLNEWEWLQDSYGPLFVSQDVLDFDKLNERTKETAIKYLQPIKLDTPEMYNLFSKYSREFAPIAIADCSTLAIAKHQKLLCGTDDGKMIKICNKYQINYTRTLRLLKEMSDTGCKTVRQVVQMKNILIDPNQRGKYVHPKILTEWQKSL